LFDNWLFHSTFEEWKMAKTVSLTLNKPVSQLNVADLKNLIREIFEELIREIVRQEQRPSYYLDESGHKVFFNEYAYSRFVESHPDKLPSELDASFIDAQGFRCHYSDYELKPLVASRLRRSSRSKAITSTELKKRLRKMGVPIHKARKAFSKTAGSLAQAIIAEREERWALFRHEAE
jgi:hypothetical protein